MNKLLKSFLDIFNRNKMSNISHLNKTSKTVLSATEHLTLNAQTKQKIEAVKNNINNIAKDLEYNPEKICEFIKNSNTNIFFINNANYLLKFIGETEGLITELQGIKALFLNIITRKIFSTNTKPMFVMRNKNVDPAIFLHHFYKWYAIQMDLPGFDFKTQQNFKKFFKNDKNIDKLPINEIIELQEAIARDKEATSFALAYIQQTKGAKNVKEKMIKEGGANI